MTSNKTARELFCEANHKVGIQNVHPNKFRRYIWNVETPEGEEIDADLILDDQLKFAAKFRSVRIEAACGLTIITSQ